LKKKRLQEDVAAFLVKYQPAIELAKVELEMKK
jgi:hypothetical protein